MAVTQSRSQQRTLRGDPAIATIVAWKSCEHVGPVFEGDVARTELSVKDTSQRGVVGLRGRVSAVRPHAILVLVLDSSSRAVVG